MVYLLIEKRWSITKGEQVRCLYPAQWVLKCHRQKEHKTIYKNATDPITVPIIGLLSHSFRNIDLQIYI